MTSFINGDGYQLLVVDELASFALNAGQYVREVKIEAKARAAVFLIYRSKPAGAYYHGVVTVALGESNAGVEFRS